MKTYLFKTETYLAGSAHDIGYIKPKKIRAENLDKAFDEYRARILKEDHCDIGPDAWDAKEDLFEDPDGSIPNMQLSPRLKASLSFPMILRVRLLW